MANITLINPPHLELKLNYSSIFHPPLGLAYIASYMRQKGHNVFVIDAISRAIDKRSDWSANKDITIVGLGMDEVVERIPDSSDVIGVTCMFTPTWPYVRELTKAVKRRFPKIPLVIGGEHVTGVWDGTLATSPVDFCVLGEGEITFEELVRSIEEGSDCNDIRGIAYRRHNRLVLNEARPRIRDLDSIPYPAWDLIDIERYMEKKLFMGACKGRTIPLLATRGCPYKCRFCSSSNMWRPVWIPRSPEGVIAEIETYIKRYNANDFHLMDLTAIIQRDWTIRFANEIVRKNLKISWQLPVGTRTASIDKEVTDLLIKSGCKDITFAPESGSKKVLERMGKRMNLRQMEDAIKAALGSGMTTCLFFLIGFPGEEMEDVKETFHLIRRMAFIGVHEIAISTFIPIPGSAIFNEFREKDPKHFELTDEFCYVLFSSLSLNKSGSWNTAFSDRQLLRLKIRGLVMFYAISYIIRPWRLIKCLINLFTGQQQTKVDRVLQEMIFKGRWGR